MVIVYRLEELYAEQIIYFRESTDRIVITTVEGKQRILPKETLKERKVFFNTQQII